MRWDKRCGSRLPCIAMSLLIFFIAQPKSTDQSRAIQSTLLSKEYLTIEDPALNGKPITGTKIF